MPNSYFLSAFAICLCLTGFAQTKDEVRPLEPGRIVEREIAGGQTHTYQITLQAGQFARFMVEQRGVDVALALTGPDGETSQETNFSKIGGKESLSLVAAQEGRRQLMVRALLPNAEPGDYSLRIEVRDAVTAQDRQRIEAERLLAEGRRLSGEARIERLRPALELWREVGDQYWEMITLNSIAGASRMLSRFQESIELSEKSVQISRQIADKPGEANALAMIGVAHSLTGDHEKAIAHFEQVLAIRREAKLWAYEAQSLTDLGTAYLGASRYLRAIEYLEQALRIARERKNLDDESGALHNLGESYFYIGRYERAIECYERGLAIHRELKDRYSEGTTLASLGSAYFKLGRPDQANEYHEQSLRIKRELKDRNGEGFTLNHMGSIAESQGRYEQSLDLIEQAHAIFREVKNRTMEAITLQSLSIVDRRLGLSDKAIGRLEEALKISREVKDKNGEANNLRTLGEIHQEQGRAGQAIEILEQALAIFRELKIRADEGSVLSLIGFAHFSLGRPDDAARYFEQSLAISREVADRPGEGRALAGFGLVHKASGRMEQAVSYFQQALVIHREVKDRASEIETLFFLAEVERKRGRLDQARSLIEECLRLAESLRAGIDNPERRVSYRALAQNSYEFYIDLLMHLHRANPGQGYDALAFKVSEQSRARGLIEMLAESRDDIRHGVDGALLNRERSIAWQINAKAQQLAQRPTPEQAATLNSEISQLEDEYQQAQTAIRRASPRYEALARPQPLTLPEIQLQLDEKTLLLEYALGAERSYLWAMTHNTLDSYELPGRDQLEQSARRVYDLLVARGHRLKGETPRRQRARIARADAQLPKAGHQMSRMLLGPVAAKLRDKRLVIVADGALQYLPFAMLPAPESGRAGEKTNPQSAIRNPQSFTPLVVKHEVISLPSASTLAVHRRELSGREPAPNGVAVIADPVFYDGDERITAAKTKIAAETPSTGAAQSLANTRIIEHLAEDAAQTVNGSFVIPRLPFTRQEAERILAASPGSPNLKAIDFKANRTTVTGAELSKYRYVHFATHGLIDSERPWLSALALSLVDEQGKPQDGFLRAHEIYKLKLSAELVTLSACRTGLGRETKGEGLVGLTRGFMYAGAARVVVSLWSVNDKATSELMASFYQRMLKEGQRPAEALRLAQVEMWRRSQWRAPYFWAAFVLQGEWR
ncbi:MAG TPA: tetratricopeptide repeat protein [Blastocatellia bacterium]|nr:tetratricopeptide repeat protein [Blastocatellia bacterium]